MDVPAQFTIKLCKTSPGLGSALVIGVATKEIRDAVIADIGKKLIAIGDWYRYDGNLFDIFIMAWSRDQKAEAYLPFPGIDIDQAGKYAVLFYARGGPYMLTASYLEKEKTKIGSFIKTLDVTEQVDWYWVKREDINTIIEYASRPLIKGTTISMIDVTPHARASASGK